MKETRKKSQREFGIYCFKSKLFFINELSLFIGPQSINQNEAQIFELQSKNYFEIKNETNQKFNQL